jgi:beta-N-acetylhexosaminidase
MSGLQERGVAATLKHFPGFGAARVSTDFAPVTIELPRSVLRRVDEKPFTDLASDQPGLVMLSTAVYPGLSANPAALSRTVATGELRDRIGFTGVSISDDLEARGLASVGTVGEVAVRAARAGTDLLLFARTYRAGAAGATAVSHRVKRNAGFRLRAQHAVRRILVLRRDLGRLDGG